MENHLNFVVALLWCALGYQTSSFFVLLLVPLLGSVFNTGHLFKGQSMLLLVFTWVLTVLLTFQYQLTNFALGVTQQRRNLSEDHSPSEQVTNLHTERTGLGDSLRIAWTSRKANILYYVKTIMVDGGWWTSFVGSTLKTFMSCRDEKIVWAEVFFDPLLALDNFSG